MSFEVNGKMIETDANGFLSKLEDWNETVAEALAKQEEIPALTQAHWDVINYLRNEYINNSGNQPNMRTMVKAMQDAWNDKKVDSKRLYDLFPKGPPKQAGKIAGLPENKRKGGY